VTKGKGGTVWKEQKKKKRKFENAVEKEKGSIKGVIQGKGENSLKKNFVVGKRKKSSVKGPTGGNHGYASQSKYKVLQEGSQRFRW